MIPTILNYYYYYGGLPENGKQYDLLRLTSFLNDASSLIYGLVLDDRLNKGFFKVFEENERKGFRLNEWVLDVKTNITKELRDLKLSNLVNEDLNYMWAKLDSFGLTGVQLESKLNFWNQLFQKVKDWFNNKLAPFDNEVKIILKNALAATNILIGSICAALPGFEQLKELKDFFELSLDIE